jgi:hypothetical protein
LARPPHFWKRTAPLLKTEVRKSCHRFLKRWGIYMGDESTHPLLKFRRVFCRVRIQTSLYIYSVVQWRGDCITRTQRLVSAIGGRIADSLLVQLQAICAIRNSPATGVWGTEDSYRQHERSSRQQNSVCGQDVSDDRNDEPLIFFTNMLDVLGRFGYNCGVVRISHRCVIGNCVVQPHPSGVIII